MPNSPLPDSSPDSWSVNTAVTDLNAVTPEGDTDLSPPSRERSPSLLGWLGIVIFRAGILAIGGVIAMVAGMAIATRHPTTVDQPPLLEKVLQGIETIR